MDLNTPEGRYAATQALGHDGYSAAMKAHIEASTIETVNGYAIRPVRTQFGRLFQVGTKVAFRTLAEARAHAAKEPNGATVAETEIRERMEQHRKGYRYHLTQTNRMSATWANNCKGSYYGAARELAALTGKPVEAI